MRCCIVESQSQQDRGLHKVSVYCYDFIGLSLPEQGVWVAFHGKQDITLDFSADCLKALKTAAFTGPSRGLPASARALPVEVLATRASIPILACLLERFD